MAYTTEAAPATQPSSIEHRVQCVLNRNTEMKATKNPWLDLWQMIGEFIHMRRMDFNTTRTAGEFLTREIFDTAAPKASKTAASSILSMLWPQSVKRMRLKPPIELTETREVKEYFEKVTAKLLSVMDNPKAGLPMALDEAMLEIIDFGTVGVEVLKSKETKVCYKPWGVKNISIAEGSNGFVDTVYVEVKLPVHIIVKEYGIDKVSDKVRGLFNARKFDQEFNVLIAVEPRITDDFAQPGKGNLGLPFQSVHIEMETKKLLRESGFSEMPIKVARFWKILGEVYGRSPAMDALPSALEANAIWEAVTIAIEKNLDPPLGVLDDGKLGGGEIDTSAGAVNVFNISGRAGEKNPIFPLYTVGEIKQTVNLIETLEQDISDHFFIDRLLDFNNETRMTLGEANLRNRLRNSTLGSIFTRLIAELFSPIIERTFNIMFELGEFGYAEDSVDYAIATQINGESPMIIPAEVAKLMKAGRNVYDIEYFTPALRIMQAEEANGILQTYDAAILMKNAGMEHVSDNLDGDISIRRISNISGAPSEILRAKKDVTDIRDARLEVAEEQAAAEQLKSGAEALRNVGQSGMVAAPGAALAA
jgi:hypothetical protein